MGICGSGYEEPPEQNDNEEAYIIHIVNSENIPTKGVDLLDGIQAYCNIKVKTADGSLKQHEFSECKTSIRHSSNAPIWNAYRKIVASPNDIVHIELYDEDWFDDDYLGEAQIQINSDLKFNEIITLPFTMKKQFANFGSKVNIKLLKEQDSSFKNKRIYFLRHAESEFNAALRKSNIVGMWSKTDHPLTAKGVEQAEAFNAKITDDNNDSDDDDDLKDFLSVDGIWSSPLCRAVETTCIGLYKHPILTKKGLLLTSNCREFKAIGGRDSTGSKLGSEIRDRCFNKIEKHKNSEYAQKYEQIAWDFNDTTSKWWAGLQDRGKKDVNSRFTDFVNFVRYRPEENIIIVSHSAFIRFFFKRYLPKRQDKYFDALYDDEYETLYFYDDDEDEEEEKKERKKTEMEQIDKETRLSTYKLQNCGCIRVDVNFDDSHRDGVLVQDTKLVFGSRLLKRGRKSHNENE